MDPLHRAGWRAIRRAQRLSASVGIHAQPASFDRTFGLDPPAGPSVAFVERAPLGARFRFDKEGFRRARKKIVENAMTPVDKAGLYG